MAMERRKMRIYKSKRKKDSNYLSSNVKREALFLSIVIEINQNSERLVSSCEK